MDLNFEEEFELLISKFIDDESKKRLDVREVDACLLNINTKTACMQKQIDSAGEYLKKLTKIKAHHKKIFNSSPMNIVSLGDNCIPRNILTRFGLKKTKAEGELSTPFDLAIHPVSTVAELIDTGFCDYLNPAELKIGYGHPVHDRLRVMFNHESPTEFRVNNYEKLISRYKARIANFYSIISTGKNLFVVNTNKRQGIDELIIAIGNRLEPTDDVLLVLNIGNEAFNVTEFISVDGLTLEILNCPFPNTDYIWYKPKYYSTKMGYAFESKVSLMVAGILQRSQNESIILSKKNIAKMCASETLNFDGIINLLHDDFVKKLKKDVKGEGFEAHRDVCSMLEEYSERHDLHIDDLDGMSVKFIYNLAYAFPNILLRTLSDPLKYFLTLGHYQYQSLLTRPTIQAYLNSTLADNVELWVSHPKNLLTLLLALTANQLNLVERESYLISHFIKKMSFTKFELPCKALKMRLAAISKNNEINNISLKKGRIALFLTGQLRGYKEALPSILNNFNDLSNVDVFISTWEEIGGTQYTEERLDRIFEKDAIEKIREEGIFEQVRSIYESEERELNASFNICKELEEYCNGVHSVKINIKSGREYPFNKMTNPEKMYYHNAFWIESLGEGYFENYSTIVKVRPDLWFPESEDKFDEVKCEPNTVYCENKDGWIYREWGFGMGDQLMYGAASSMINILAVHGGNNITTKLVDYLTFGRTRYVGHMNCGIRAWVDGLNCKYSTVIPQKLCSVKKITLPELELLLTVTAAHRDLKVVKA
jgi:hypothetical protein